MGSANIQGELWGQAPRDWTDLMASFQSPFWEAVLDAARVGKGTRLLDAGCGSGGASVLAAERGADVSGLDASGPLIEVAREQVPDADFRVGEMEELPYGDGAFDAVVAISSLQYTEDKQRALGELVRVCTSGGRVVVAMFDSPDKLDFAPVFAALAGLLPARTHGNEAIDLAQPGVLEELIEEAGMTLDATGSRRCVFQWPDFETLWRAMVAGGPIQAVMRAVDPGKVQVAIRDAVQPYRMDGKGYRMVNWFRYVGATP
jgi:SAM-dependent methyltransferase